MTTYIPPQLPCVGLFCCIFFIREDSSKIIEYSIKDANTNKKQQTRYTSIFFM